MDIQSQSQQLQVLGRISDVTCNVAVSSHVDGVQQIDGVVEVNVRQLLLGDGAHNNVTLHFT